MNHICYIGLEANARLFRALSTGRFTFQYISFELDPCLIDKTVDRKFYTLLIHQSAIQKTGIAFSCDYLKQNNHVESLGIIANAEDLDPLLTSDWCYKLNGILDLSFSTKQLLACIQRVAAHKPAFECFGEKHPVFNSKIAGFLEGKPTLNHLELEELKALHRLGSIAKYAKEKDVARSTGYRRFERLALKENVSSIEALRYKACAKGWV